MNRTKGSKENHKLKMTMKRNRRKSLVTPKMNEEELISWMRANNFVRGKYVFAH